MVYFGHGFIFWAGRGLYCWLCANASPSNVSPFKAGPASFPIAMPNPAPAKPPPPVLSSSTRDENINFKDFLQNVKNKGFWKICLLPAHNGLGHR